ncbi:MAG: hypothetical protein KUL88_00055 [Rhizobium sp.]|nr:hypothetical protein [Rhizobium sp.]
MLETLDTLVLHPGRKAVLLAGRCTTVFALEIAEDAIESDGCLTRLAGIKAQIGYNRHSDIYCGGLPVVVDNS